MNEQIAQETIWVSNGIEGKEELAKLLNNLQQDSRYGNWPQYIQVLVESVNQGEVFYTVIFRS